MIFNRKQPQYTLEQEHTQAVQDLISLTKLLGNARQEDILQKTDKSRQKVENYERDIAAVQVRAVRLSEKINKRAEEPTK